LIARSLDEPLSPREQARVEAHLQECLTCRIASDGLLEFDALLKRTAMVIPEAGFPLRVLARLDRYERRRTRVQWLITLGLLFLGALAALAWLILNLGGVFDALASLVHALEVILPAWFNAVLDWSAYGGRVPLFIYACLALVLTVVWARVVGGFTPVEIRS
jgi:predicted anti-sigma-YlaC factor YlaD